MVALRQQSVRIRSPCHLAGDQSAAQSRSIQDSMSRLGDGAIPLIVPPFGVIVCPLLTLWTLHIRFGTLALRIHCRSKYATYCSRLALCVGCAAASSCSSTNIRLMEITGR